MDICFGITGGEGVGGLVVFKSHGGENPQEEKMFERYHSVSFSLSFGFDFLYLAFLAPALLDKPCSQVSSLHNNPSAVSLRCYLADGSSPPTGCLYF